MRKTLGVLACLGGLLVVAEGAMACTKPKSASGIESGLIDWINAERAKKGLAGLAADPGLEAAADAHACTMAGQGKLSHQNFPGRLRKAGYGEGVENVAMSSEASADAAARIWKKSSQHWANILNRNVRTLGVGTATTGGRTYYVFMAGAP